MTTENLSQVLASSGLSRQNKSLMRRLFQAIRTAFLFGSATYDAASLIDAAGATTTVTVTGAALGDFVLVSHGVDVAGITVTAWVSAANTVSVRFQNESGGTLDLASSTLRVMVLKRSSFDGTFIAGLRV